MPKEKISIKVDYMQQRHMDDVENLENSLFEHPWSRDELESARRKRYYISKVAIITPENINKKIVAGALFAEQDKSRIIILSIAVNRDWVRYGIGSALLLNIKRRLRQNSRNEICELVRETNIVAQKFYSANGFVATKPIRNSFDSGEDAYPMVFKWEWSPQGISECGKPEKCHKRKHLCIKCGDCD